MVRRHNNQLPLNLPQLQNLIKRDPTSYKDEFVQQQRHYKSLLSVFKMHPNEYNKNLDDLVMFMAQVAQCYPDLIETFAQEIMDVLQTHSTILDPDMRMTFCRALILLRNKNLLTPTDLLSLFFQLLHAQDKALRSFLQNHIVNDIKNVNSKSKNTKLNTTLQNFMYKMLNDSNTKAAKMSLDIMVELYKKNIWNDTKTVNVIATGCFSKITKVMVGALKFFLSSDEPNKDSDSESDDEPSVREVVMANKVNKKTRKRERQLKKVKSLIQKERKKKGRAPLFNFSALHLLHDPQGTAEKLFKQLEKMHERFEVKLMTLDMISRLIGLHQLILLNFYPYLQRFLQPHQKEVTRLLQFVAQASHELVPPDALEPVLKTLVNNFVTERNTSDVMAIGLNAVREMCFRCPLVMNQDLLRDLVQYKNYRDRSVMMAARSLIHLYRKSIPGMLHRKDRGRPTEAAIEMKTKKFGEVDTKDFVPGAEILLEKPKEIENDTHSDDSDSSWVDVSHSSDDEDVAEITEKDGKVEDIQEEEEVSEFDAAIEEVSGSEEEESDEGSGYEEEDDSDIDEVMEDKGELQVRENSSHTVSSPMGKSRKKKKTARNKIKTKQITEEKEKQSKEELIAEKHNKAAQVSVCKLLTDEDFKRIEAAQAVKQISNLKRGVKRPAEDDTKRNELVSLGDIENIYKKRKNSKEERIKSIRRGQEGREKFGYKDGRQNPFASTTNREKRKKKNFLMLRQKARGKVKRSFKDKQIALRNHLIRLKKMK